MKKLIPVFQSFIPFIFFMYGCSIKAADESPLNAAESMKLPVDVKVVSSVTSTSSEVVAGSIIPNREVEIMSEVTRKIISVGFKDGSYVSKGQLLFKLDDADIQAKIKQLQAEIQLAKLNESRLHALLKSESIRQEEYDAAAAKSKMLQASAQYLRAEHSKTFIRAPFSGKIGISKMRVGAIATAATPLVSLQEQSVVKLQFAISEKYLPMVKTGSKVLFSTEHNESLAATIVATESAVSTQSRSIIVHAIAPNANGRLYPGMSAKVYFKSAPENNKTILIPTQSLIPGATGYNVFVVKNGVAKLTPVTISNRNEDEAVISSGLAEGDSVMISNILRAMDGTPVQVIHSN